jgi:hypothetical protein
VPCAALRLSCLQDQERLEEAAAARLDKLKAINDQWGSEDEEEGEEDEEEEDSEEDEGGPNKQQQPTAASLGIDKRLLLEEDGGGGMAAGGGASRKGPGMAGVPSYGMGLTPLVSQTELVA